MPACVECRSEYEDGVEVCPKDGAVLVPESMLPDDDALAPGTVVGEYRIERRLGSGSFGDVYAGEHPLIGKRVAVKVLNHRFAHDAAMVARFVAEARAVNRIRQRNIIDIFSFGVLEKTRQHYFVMELLDGETLGALLERKRRLPFATVLQICEGIAAGLDAAHEAGITHRDLKPDNVFLARERDGSIFPKLLDFGIAKLVDDPSAAQTGSGLVLGTPRYMSPEQARGKRADHLADVYALGVMIHEMITGEVPFSGESSVDVLLMHASEPPPPMSSVRGDLPKALDAPVLAMLDKRPQKRPQSAGEAIKLLRQKIEELGLLERHDLPETVMLPAEATAKSPAGPPSGGASTPSAAETRVERANKSDGASARVVVESGPRGSDGEDPSRSPLAVDATLVAGREPTPQKSARGTAITSSVETPRQPPRSGASRVWAFGLAAAALLGAALFVWRARPASQSPSVAQPEVAPQEAPSTTPTSPPPPTVTVSEAPPSTVTLKLSTHPPDVDIWLGETKVGRSGEPLALQRSATRVTLKLKKTGFADGSIELVPDRDRTTEASLTPLAAPPAATSKPKNDKMERVFGERD